MPVGSWMWVSSSRLPMISWRPEGRWSWKVFQKRSDIVFEEFFWGLGPSGKNATGSIFHQSLFRFLGSRDGPEYLIFDTHPTCSKILVQTHVSPRRLFITIFIFMGLGNPPDPPCRCYDCRSWSGPHHSSPSFRPLPFTHLRLHLFWLFHNFFLKVQITPCSTSIHCKNPWLFGSIFPFFWMFS